MKKLSLILFFAIFGFIGLNAQDTPVEKVEEVPAEIQTITVEDFQDKADAFVGKEIYITGTVDHVCKHGGKKVMLVSEDGEASLKIMAGEEISKFNKNIEGENLKVRGVVQEMRMDEAYLIEKEEHVKENHKPEELEYKEDMEWIADMRKKIEDSEKGYLSFYSMDGLSYEVVK